jgi:hypothetical protein
MHSSTIQQKKPEEVSEKWSRALLFVLSHRQLVLRAREFFLKTGKLVFQILQIKNTIIFSYMYLIGEDTMECKKCGACCRLIVLQHSNPTKKSLEYYRARGWTFDPVNELVWIPSVCPHLLDNNTCNIYENRPKQCRFYPTRTPGLVVPPGCAFEK